MDRFLDYVSNSYFNKDAFDAILTDGSHDKKNAMRAMMNAGSKSKEPAYATTAVDRPLASTVPQRTPGPVKRELTDVNCEWNGRETLDELDGKKVTLMF